MGTDLMMKYQGKTIADLGRAYNYEEAGEIIKDYDSINLEDLSLQARMSKQILPIVGYAPNDLKEFNELLEEVEGDLAYFAEAFRSLGRQEMIALLAGEEGITFEKN